MLGLALDLPEKFVRPDMRLILKLLTCVGIGTLLLSATGEETAVEGVVRHSITGAALKGVIVRLVPHAEEGLGYVASTDEGGAFHFSDVAAAEYRVTLERAGFATGGTQFLYLQVKVGKQIRNLELKAVPLGAIEGRVVDSDGEPLVGADVAALRTDWWRGTRVFQAVTSAITDDRGDFRLSGLEADSYRLFAIARREFTVTERPGAAEFHVAPTYYPGGQDVTGSAAIDVAAGQEVRGIEIKLPMAPAFHVRGRIGFAGKEPNFTITAVRVDAGRRAESFEMYGKKQQDGTFDIHGVPAGTYEVAVDAFGAQASEPVTVTVGPKDADAGVLRRLLPATVRARFTLAGETEQSFGDPMLILQAASPQPERTAWANAERKRQPDHGLVFDNYRPGWYHPLLISNDFFVESMTFNGQAVDDKGILLANGSQGELAVTLARGVASITGQVKGCANCQVVAVAENVPPGGPGVFGSGTDGSGGFVFRKLVPGKYIVFAVPEDSSWPWQNATFLRLLREHGAEVELRAGSSAQVQVSALPLEDLKRAEAQIP